MIQSTVVEELEFIKADNCKTKMQVKSTSGKLYVDVRKWFKQPNMQDFMAGKQGIMLELADWKHILPLIQRLVDNNFHT